MNSEGSLDLPVAGSVGELCLVDAPVVGGHTLDAQTVGAVLLEHHKPVVLGVDVAAVFGPLAHGLGADLVDRKSRLRLSFLRGGMEN